MIGMPNKRNPQQDISHESVRIGRLIDRQKPGRYMVLIDIPPKDQPMGWDIELISIPKSERVVLKREAPPPLDKS